MSANCRIKVKVFLDLNRISIMNNKVCEYEMQNIFKESCWHWNDSFANFTELFASGCKGPSYLLGFVFQIAPTCTITIAACMKTTVIKRKALSSKKTSIICIVLSKFLFKENYFFDEAIEWIIWCSYEVVDHSVPIGWSRWSCRQCTFHMPCVLFTCCNMLQSFLSLKLFNIKEHSVAAFPVWYKFNVMMWLPVVAVPPNTQPAFVPLPLTFQTQQFPWRTNTTAD